MQKATRLIATLALTSSLAGAATADIFKPSPKDQVQLGQKVAAQIRKEEKVLPDSDPRVKFLRHLGAKIIASNPDDPKAIWQYSFDVIESKEVNAFALPGGPVFFYTGLLDKMATEDEVAAVVGHELTHVRKEHWANQYAKAQKESLLLNLALILGKANRTIADLSNLGREVFSDLKYSRSHETEADDAGMQSMIKAGYNPNGMVDTFKLLKKLSKGGQGWEFLSDHPDDDKRIKRVEENIAKLNRTFPPQKPLNLPHSKYPEDYAFESTSAGCAYAVVMSCSGTLQATAKHQQWPFFAWIR